MTMDSGLIICQQIHDNHPSECLQIYCKCIAYKSFVLTIFRRGTIAAARINLYIYTMPENSTLSNGNQPMRVAGRLAALAILVLLILAVVYYKERMLYADAPHILFRIISDGQLHIEEHRYGSFVSQAFPWLGLRLHFPLVALMIFYSAGFYIFYLSIALLLVYKFRNYALAILLGLYYTLFASDTFYWSNNEVHQGIAWLMLAFAVCNNAAAGQKSLLLQLVFFIAMFFLAIWTHPLVMLPAVYLWFFLAASKQGFKSLSRFQTTLFSVVLVVLAYIKFYQGMHHGYDSSKIESITTFDYHTLSTIFASEQFRFFTTNCVTHYWLFTILSIAGLVGLSVKRKYGLVLWTLLFFAGYLVLTCITFRDSISRSYMESEYAPLVIICCAPFVYYVLPYLKPRWVVALFSFVYVVRIIYIVCAVTPFSNRLALLEEINVHMAQKKLTKAIIQQPLPEAADHTLIITWASPVESIFISNLKGEMPQRTFIFLTADQIKGFNTASKDTLLGAWEKRAATTLNSSYVQIDTSVTYRVISYDSMMRP